MTRADSVHSTPPANTSALPIDPSRRGFLAQAAVVAAGGATLGMALPLPVSAGAADRLPDPIHAAIDRHTAAGVPWDAAIDVRADFPEGSNPLTDREWEQRDMLVGRVDEARVILDQAGLDLINTAPTTHAGVVTAIGYMRKQMRTDGTYMPYDIEFKFDDLYEGDGGVVLAWIDVWLDTIARAVAAIDGQGAAT